jgi:CxxC motif-containing protein
MGCRLDVLFDPEVGEATTIEGNRCQRALAYAQEELTSPTRMVTTTVQVRGGAWPLLPVHTAQPIPKKAIFPLLRQMRELVVEPPLRCGQVILADAAGTGVDVLASRDLPRRGGVEPEGTGETGSDRSIESIAGTLRG